MEDDLKILQVDYLSNHSSYTPQIFNLSSGDQTKIKNAWKEEDPCHSLPILNFSLAEYLKSLNLQDGPQKWHYFPGSYPPTHSPSRHIINICDIEYFSNHWTDLPQILNISLGDQTEINLLLLKLRRPPMKGDIKILKVKYLSNHSLDSPQI